MPPPFFIAAILTQGGLGWQGPEIVMATKGQEAMASSMLTGQAFGNPADSAELRTDAEIVTYVTNLDC